jgi:predicted transcriptional regulator
MTKKRTDAQLDEIAEKTERDLDHLADQLDREERLDLTVRRRGRPSMGAEPSEPLRVRLEPELKEALDERAKQEHTSTSDIVRQALRRFLEAS